MTEAEHVEPIKEAATLAGDSILARIGQLTRTLRDSMRELALDTSVERAAEAVPDARDRLRYIASMTEEAAERVLGAVEVATPIQEQLETQALALGARWESWNADCADRNEAGSLLGDTRAFLQRVPEATGATSAQLVEIMMAQEFQDLTGQVIKKITDIVQLIERQLLGVLVDNIAEDRREQFAAQAAGLAVPSDTLLNGPQINAEGNADVMQDQAQVDDLLASMGF